MPNIVRLPNLDSRVWSAAIWAAPFITQLILGAVIVTSWMFGKWVDRLHGFGLFVVGFSVTAMVSAVAVGMLLTSRSPRAHGFAVSIAGALAVVLLGGVVYGFWIIQW